MLARPGGDWPGSDDKLVVAEMLANQHSPHWHECYLFLERHIQKSDLPEDRKPDVTHEAYLSVMSALSGFHFKCRLTTWLVRVAYSRITDEWRKLRRQNQHFTSLEHSPDEGERDPEGFEVAAPLTTEDQCLFNEELREAMSGAIEYLKLHSKPERNQQIIQKVLIEQYSLQEAEQELGIPISTIRYIVQSVQRYLRERLKD